MGLAIALAVVVPGSALAAAPPPSQVSGLVWLDSNKNGVPDAGEPGVPGVTVTVRDSTGQAGAVRTDAGGRYTIAAPAGAFAVCFALPDAYADYVFTAGNGCVPGAPVVNAGIIAPPSKLGGMVWADVNKNGLRDEGEPPVPGVTVVVLDGTGTMIGSATTGPDGRYEVSDLPDGTFTVCFRGNVITRPNAGEDDLDSDANPATGCTTPLNLGPGNRENLTVDAGTVAPGNEVGDLVWLDGNRNGIKEAGEPGIPGITLLLRSGGATVARTTTNAGGGYLFGNLPDGTYQVCLDVAALPNYTVTNAESGCSPETTLGPGHRVDHSLDFGLVAAFIPSGGSGSQG